MKSIFLFIFFCFPFFSTAQIYGLVTDETGEPLPFASIYVKGTSQGTTTNAEGEYNFQLDPGRYTLVYQYIGYEQQFREVRMDKQPLEVNIQLEQEAIKLSLVEVTANAEDPAYPIIRKAIEKRKYYRDLVESYQCHTYIKGNVELLDAPEKIFGQDIGDMGGLVDSTGKGILYLSESESTFYWKQPNQQKEVMISSKVSGNDTGFSFNNAADMQMDVYENTSDFGRPVVSPIASNALSYYQYRLIGTVFDEEGRLINKIEVMPRRSEDPVYAGVIYIVEDLWNVQSFDLYLTGKAVNRPFFDTLFVKTTYVPVQEPDIWRVFSRHFSMKGKFFGFEFMGSFAGIFSDYKLDPDLKPGFFDNEIFTVEEGANEKDLMYFDSIRPLPLTKEEQVDYVKKDSLEELYSSEAHLDSVDAENNRFKPGNLLLGYTYNRSYEQWSLGISSPLGLVLFNTVQGWTPNIDLSYRKRFKEAGIRSLEGRVRVSYGIAEKQWRAAGFFTTDLNRTHFTQVKLSGGRQTSSFNGNEPISPFVNELYSLYAKRNYLKIYDQYFASGFLRHELWNGALLRFTATYADRRSLINNTDYSFFNKKRDTYTANDPRNPEADGIPAFEDHQMILFKAKMRLRINQKYISYPDRKIELGSRWPEFWIHYHKGISVGSASGEGRGNFDYLEFQIKENDLKLGLLGYSALNLRAGLFLQQDDLWFIDYKHFNGNQTIFGDVFDYQEDFLLMPYYEFSTTDPHLQVHFQHFFDGWLLDKVPLIKKLNLTSVLGGHYLYTETFGHYWEVSFGVDRIGFGLFKLLRLDVAASFRGDEFDRVGVLIGLRMPQG